MFDVYFVNCFLAVILAFIGGAYYRERVWIDRMKMMVKAGGFSGTALRMPSTKDTSDDRPLH
jgi:hypothetical protein